MQMQTRLPVEIIMRTRSHCQFPLDLREENNHFFCFSLFNCKIIGNFQLHKFAVAVTAAAAAASISLTMNDVKTLPLSIP